MAQDLKFDSVEDLVASVGYGQVTARRVLNRLYAVMHPENVGTQSLQPVPAKEVKGDSGRKKDGVSISGIDGVLMRFAQCCNPVPGDAIVGYISRGVGITVHRRDCPNVANMEMERLINVYWDGEEEKPYEAGIFVIAKNEQGALANIAQAIARNGVNISGLSMNSTLDGRAKMKFQVEVRNATQLYKLIEDVRAMPSVLEVIRESESDDL